LRYSWANPDAGGGPVLDSGLPPFLQGRPHPLHDDPFFLPHEPFTGARDHQVLEGPPFDALGPYGQPGPYGEPRPYGQPPGPYGEISAPYGELPPAPYEARAVLLPYGGASAGFYGPAQAARLPYGAPEPYGPPPPPYGHPPPPEPAPYSRPLPYGHALPAETAPYGPPPPPYGRPLPYGRSEPAPYGPPPPPYGHPAPVEPYGPQQVPTFLHVSYGYGQHLGPQGGPVGPFSGSAGGPFGSALAGPEGPYGPY